ncbi:hypothetical protein GCM10025771_29870 [Niveibacterium umoris]|uniref:DUF2946 domain-containing protein n=1 Tax=Niveibacterium umoris TaxID=1193620 RepID=A0A840BFL8_9RHOO|nr:hypothetical protein [Niveibacterium umoris]
MFDPARHLKTWARIALLAVLMAATAPTISRALASLDPRFDAASLCRVASDRKGESSPASDQAACPYCLVANLGHALGSPPPTLPVPTTRHGVPQAATAAPQTSSAPHWGDARAPPILTL